ncbi:MAG: dihydrofolate reductase [Gemmatimonadota bacterium]
MDPNGAIGRDGELPWHHSADLRFFKRTTVGHTVVMGRRTWESIGRPLPDRLNIVLTRRGIDASTGSAGRRDDGDDGDDDAAAGHRRAPMADAVIEASSVEAALRAHAERAQGDLFVIGGARVYRAFAPRIAEWIVTRVPEAVDDADTFLPASLLEPFSVHRTEAIGDGLVVEYLRRR